MKLKIILFGFSLLVSNSINAQVPHDVNVPSNGNAERVARFKVQDDAYDFLEITNATKHSGKFIPKIWAHQQSDNRFVLDFMATTKSNFDSGNIPLMTFRSELRNSINLNAPSGGAFPWGQSRNNVVNRPLFGWYNGSTEMMILRANGNLGLGITSPTARLHTNGTLRFQNLPNATTPKYLLGTDSSGNVKEYPASISSGGSDKDWEKTGGGTPTSIFNNIYTYGRVGVNTSSPSANLHTNGSVRLQNLPLGRGNPSYLLGVDVNGNVKKYQQITIFLKKMQETIEKQENQITLLQNKISNFEKNPSLNLKKTNNSFSTNFPNPFSLTTTIEYTILKDVKDAKIIIYNTNGSTIKTYNLKERETKGTLTINKQGMKSGVYFYTMITDGIVMGTKKMIVK